MPLQHLALHTVIGLGLWAGVIQLVLFAGRLLA
jgi:hypothetical protein